MTWRRSAHASADPIDFGAGPWAALGYAAALPVSGLAAHHYLRALRRYGGRLRTAGLLLERPLARRTLVAMRARLIAALEAFRADYRERVVQSGPFEAEPGTPPALSGRRDRRTMPPARG